MDNCQWPYSDIDESFFLTQITSVEEFLQKHGAKYAGVSHETCVWQSRGGPLITEEGTKKIWNRNGMYIRVDRLYYSQKPFLVLEISNNPEGPYEDAAPFPYDLCDNELELEVKLVLDI